VRPPSARPAEEVRSRCLPFDRTQCGSETEELLGGSPANLIIESLIAERLAAFGPDVWEANRPTPTRAAPEQHGDQTVRSVSQRRSELDGIEADSAKLQVESVSGQG
jgi:hypothetical protein